MSSADTIFALATPPGKSGVAIIRLSGPQAITVLQQLTGREDFTPRQADYAVFRSPGGEIIDRGLALYFQAPASFTGEDVAELHLHGSLAVIREMLSVLANIRGLRPADPGEFSRRAFLNGKMDLIEAEGLADLIAAETLTQKRQALGQMEGSISGYYEQFRQRIIHC
ncbi:MAG: tRNA uridine-5-carboxymethylaminomethyl(34) synthesis GTPase MnmE, partial [Pseudomonadota bacterium]|nr:tRNA uridine-5-carboxymethylaminomethyl(34) synthesis GTPase MnmE [Pseudomonadota bacterium]